MRIDKVIFSVEGPHIPGKDFRFNKLNHALDKAEEIFKSDAHGYICVYNHGLPAGPTLIHFYPAFTPDNNSAFTLKFKYNEHMVRYFHCALFDEEFNGRNRHFKIQDIPF